METIAAGEIFDAVASRAGLTTGEIDVDLFATLRGSLRRRVREGWRHAKWPEVTRNEKRRFRANWLSSPVYAVGDEVYYAVMRKYYCSIRSNAGQAPADEVGKVNSAYWAESKEAYAADDWSETKGYFQGNQVYEPGSDAFFQCHTDAPVGTVTTDVNFWGRLTAFSRYVPYDQELAGGLKATPIGDVLRVTEKDPRQNLAPLPLDYTKTENGVLIFKGVTEAWIEFRLRPPAFSGDVYDPARAYPNGAQAYFIDEANNVPGNFYVAPGGALVGQNPETVGIWILLEIPLFLERFLVGAVYADYLESEGQKEKYVVELADARGLLADEWQELTGQEGQNERMEVGTR